MNKVISHLFNDVYKPVKAILIYHSVMQEKFYVESMDMDATGAPINPHPISLSEANELAEALSTTEGLRQDFLMAEGLMPENILHINSLKNGHAIWYTPPMQVSLSFLPSLTIADGMASVPPLVWKASKTAMSIYAVGCEEKPTLNTSLYFAPFFNVYAEGKVCMGSVNINVPAKCSLEQFIELWQSYFFSSTFSHLLGSHSPVKGNIIELWQKQMNCDKPFPLKKLKPINKTLKSIL